MQMPVWLVLAHWQQQSQVEVEGVNISSLAVAKLSTLIESALNAFGGDSNTSVDMGKYLPFCLEEQEEIAITKETGECFWDLVDNYFDDEQHIKLVRAFGDKDVRAKLFKHRKKK